MKFVRLVLLFGFLGFINLYGQARKHQTITANSLQGSIQAGHLVFTQNCLTCHQVDGLGVQNMNPSLVGTSYVLGEKTQLIRVLLNGLSHQSIDGDTYQNVMPSQSSLSDKQIADVLTYVRSSFGNKAGPILRADVAKVRSQKL